MVDLKNVKYFPILKTTDAELKAFSNLDPNIKDNIVPVFELTRSRRSKKNMDRDISKRLVGIKEVVDSRPFILDLTTDKQLLNEQIAKILNTHEGGFPLWVDLIEKWKNNGLNIIPIIHYDEQNIEDVQKEIMNLLRLSEFVAFRAPVNEAIEYIKQFNKMGVPFNKLILILDADYIEPLGQPDKSNLFIYALDMIINNFSSNMPQYIACAFSSFPDSVAKYGQDDKGGWIRYEKFTYNHLQERYHEKTCLHLVYSDYASVHPRRYDTAGGQWIPRVDFITKDQMCYYRYRRDDGGYSLAAQLVQSDKKYIPIQTVSVWGDNEIRSAAEGEPHGSAPSHWISVRINLYITRTVLELTARDRNPL